MRDDTPNMFTLKRPDQKDDTALVMGDTDAMLALIVTSRAGSLAMMDPRLIMVALSQFGYLTENKACWADLLEKGDATKQPHIKHMRELIKVLLQDDVDYADVKYELTATLLTLGFPLPGVIKTIAWYLSEDIDTVEKIVTKIANGLKEEIDMVLNSRNDGTDHSGNKNVIDFIGLLQNEKNEVTFMDRVTLIQTLESFAHNGVYTSVSGIADEDAQKSYRMQLFSKYMLQRTTSLFLEDQDSISWHETMVKFLITCGIHNDAIYDAIQVVFANNPATLKKFDDVVRPSTATIN